MTKIRVVRDCFSDLFFVEKRVFFFFWKRVYSSSQKSHCLEAASRYLNPEIVYP